MEIKLIKDWDNGRKVIPSGKVFHVTESLGRSLIIKKIAIRVKDALLFGLVKNVGPQDGDTKQSAAKQKKVKHKKED